MLFSSVNPAALPGILTNAIKLDDSKCSRIEFKISNKCVTKTFSSQGRAS